MATQADLDKAVSDADASAKAAKASEDAAKRSADDAATKLQPKLITRAFDPDLTSNIDTDLAPLDPAHQTKGPNRFTVLVPTEHTVFSLGDKGAADRTQEVGIRGETDSHVHFRARTPDTLVRLGTKGGHKIDGFNAGYLVHTAGEAKQESIGSHVVQSIGSNILLHTKGEPPAPPTPPPTPPGAKPSPPPPAPEPLETIASLQSDHGFVEVVAGHRTTVAATGKVLISADESLSLETRAKGSEFYGSATKWTTAQHVKATLGVADWLASVYSVATTFLPASSSAESGSVGWRETPNRDWAKITVDIAKLVTSTSRLATTLEWQNPGSKVSIYASDAVSIAGDSSVSLNGTYSASVTSALSASLLGGTASVKGLGYASLWAGQEVSVKAIKNARVEGERGTASLRGKKGAEVSSFNGPVVVQGKSHVRLASTTGIAYVYGEDGVSIACGANWGLFADASSMRMGKITSSPKALEKPTFSDSLVIDFLKHFVSIEVGSSTVEVLDGAINLRAKNLNGLELDKDGNVDVKASGKIHLGS